MWRLWKDVERKQKVTLIWGLGWSEVSPGYVPLKVGFSVGL